MTSENQFDWGCRVIVNCTTCLRGENPPPPWDLGINTTEISIPHLKRAHSKKFPGHQLKVQWFKDVNLEVKMS